jgi:hypothetical protein
MPAYTALLAACSQNPVQDSGALTYNTFRTNINNAISIAIASVSAANVTNSTTNFTAAQTAVQAAVKDFGGTIRMESVLGQGCKFIIEIPIKNES